MYLTPYFIISSWSPRKHIDKTKLKSSFLFHFHINLVFYKLKKFFSYKPSSLSSLKRTIGLWHLPLPRPLLQVITKSYQFYLLRSSQISPFNLPPPIKCKVLLFSPGLKIFSQLFYTSPQNDSIPIYSPYCSRSNLPKMQIRSHFALA